MNAPFQHQRHKPLTPLEQPRELVLAVPPMQSNVNLSRIVRAASCFGVRRIVAAGAGKVDRKISRDAADEMTVEVHRSLIPVLKKMRGQGYRLVGLEQATHSQVLYDYRFERKTLLVVGHERNGISESELALLDDVVEIPVHGLPYSHNAATSAAIAIYEYCRQYPAG